jgi:hypothetical protein
LSRQLNLPPALDDTADARHDSLPLVVLLAFLQAQRVAEAAPAAPTTTPHVRPAPEGMICCDNFRLSVIGDRTRPAIPLRRSYDVMVRPVSISYAIEITLAGERDAPSDASQRERL